MQVGGIRRHDVIASEFQHGPGQASHGVLGAGAASRPQGCEKLSGAEKYRVRQGDYRIFYEIDDSAKTVIIVKVGNRKEV